MHWSVSVDYVEDHVPCEGGGEDSSSSTSFRKGHVHSVGEGGKASILESHSCGDESSDTGDVARTHLMTIVMTMMIIREIFVQDNYQMCVKSL